MLRVAFLVVLVAVCVPMWVLLVATVRDTITDLRRWAALKKERE